MYSTQAQDIMVSGAGTSDVNGLYVENGTYNGKPKYEYSGSFDDYAIVWECHWFGPCDGWYLMTDYGGFYDDPPYFTWDAGATPPSTGWEDAFGSNPAPTVGPAGPMLSYSSSLFRESSANDGSISGSTNDFTISHNGFGGNVFTGTNGEDFVTGSKVTVTNLPTGLAVSIVRVSDTELTFSLSGNATNHANAQDVSNLTIAFQNSAFSGGVATDINNYQKNDFEINFIQKHTVASSGADFTTIAAAIAAADDYDEICLSAETFTEVGLTVTKALTFRGEGAGQTIIQASATPNSGGGRIFNISSTPDVIKFYDLTIQNGDVSGGNPYSAGIYSQSTLEMYRCEILDCRSTATAANTAAGIATIAGSDDYVVLEDCLFEGNSATTSGSQMSGGGVFIQSSGNNEITNCTFVNNSVSGGGGSGQGGGLYCGSGSFVISNSTFSNNTASSTGGGIYTQTGLTLKNVISYGNTASSGTDFYRYVQTTNASNCIIGGSAANSGAAINGTSSSVSSSNPMLQSLADNGGPTETIALGVGSPAIDAGLSGETELDQRGYFRNGVRDIGSYEYEGITNVWNGSEDTDWTNANNWADGTVPTSGEDVAIAPATNNPEISGTPASPTQVDELYVLDDAILVIGAGKALSTSGNTDNEGTILIEADATGIGSFIDNGTITGSGSFQMQQYLTGSGGATPDGLFWYVSSPVASATSNVYDAAGTDKLWSANEVTQSHPAITDNVTSLSVTKGYVARLGATDTKTFTGGAFNTGDLSASGLTRTGTSAPSRGYNLVGNPYPSTVNWNDLTRTNLKTSMWYRTHNGSTMLYDTYNASGMVGTNNNGSGTVDGTIPPTQAFWVLVDVDGNTGQLDFENADRSHGTLASIYKTESEEGTIRLALSDGNVSDEQIILFNPAAQDGFDDYDSHKFWASNVPQLYSNILEDTLTINGLYSPQTNPTVPLGIKLPSQGDYTLNATSITFTETPVHLEDTYLNVFQDLNINPNYAFTSMEGNISDRFILHFSAITGVDETESDILIYSSANQIYINRAEASNALVTVFDLSGRTILTENINSQNATIQVNAPMGIYLVRVETAEQTTTKKLTIR